MIIIQEICKAFIPIGSSWSMLTTKMTLLCTDHQKIVLFSMYHQNDSPVLYADHQKRVLFPMYHEEDSPVLSDHQKRVLFSMYHQNESLVLYAEHQKRVLFSMHHQNESPVLCSCPVFYAPSKGSLVLLYRPPKG